MPKIGSRSLVWALASCLGLWVFLGQAQKAAANLSYRGTWEARENDEGRLLQLDDHLFSFLAGQDLIGNLSSTENVSYNYHWEQELGTRETVSPGASLSLNNDIFLASLAVNSTKNLNNSPNQMDSDALGFIWASRWRKSFVPELRASYDSTRQRQDAKNALVDQNQQSYGAEVNWDLRAAQIYYGYRRNDVKNPVYQDISDSHLARINVARSWMKDRLRVSFGQEYSKINFEQRVPFSTSNTANVFVTLADPYTSAAPALALTDDSLLVPSPLLLDTNLTVPAYAALTAVGNPNYIRLRTGGQQVDRIFLYTQINMGPAPSGINWRVYTNDDPSFLTPWNQVAAVVSYDTVNQRFVVELPVAVKTNYVKLVLDLAGLTTITFTEVQAQQVLHGDVGTTISSAKSNQADKSNITLDFRLNNSVAFFYNLLLAKEKTDAEITNDRESHNGGVRMQNSGGDLKSTLSYSLNRQRYTTSPESRIQTYQFSLNKILLPTLSMALGASHDDNSLYGATISRRNRYTFYADAKLYPDLSSQLEVIYFDQKNTPVGTAESKNDDLRTKITFSSRFRPSLVVTLSEVYEITNQTDKESTELNNLAMSSSWQVSDLLSLYGTLARDSGSLIHDAYTYTLGVAAGMGSGLELKASYSLRTAESRTQSGVASLRWSSTKNVSWEVGCNYADTNVGQVPNLYKFYSQLIVNFATL